jgi:hypothetical protein
VVCGDVGGADPAVDRRQIDDAAAGALQARDGVFHAEQHALHVHGLHRIPSGCADFAGAFDGIDVECRQLRAFPAETLDAGAVDASVPPVTMQTLVFDPVHGDSFCRRAGRFRRSFLNIVRLSRARLTAIKKRVRRSVRQ